MGSTVLRSIEWIKIGQNDPGPAEHVGASELQRFFRHSGFALAFLEAKRRRRLRNPSRDVTVSVVFEGRTPVDFGHPCDWKEGVAARVLGGGTLSVANLHFAVSHEGGDDDEFAAGPRTSTPVPAKYHKKHGSWMLHR